MSKKQKVIFIKNNRDNFKLSLLLELTKIKRSYWDKYKNKEIYENDKEALNNIVKVFKENREQSGYRKITEYLRNEYGIIYNFKKVLRIMRENGIQAQYVQKMRKKIRIRQRFNKIKINHPDLVNKNFKSIINRHKVLFTDVTYLIWNGKKHYQSTIIDGFIKEIIDVKWSKYNNNKLVMDNLNDAIKNIKEIRNDLNGIIIHSDHGYQYTSKIYHDKCISNGI